jgi:hypothetical protein
MRFFDGWWERVLKGAHLLPLLVAAYSVVHQLPMDYFWERLPR